MSGETMREAVEMAILEAAGGMEHGKPANISVLADAAIRTVLKRLREVTPAMEQAFYRSHCGPSASPSPDGCWQAMLDAAAREVGEWIS